MDKEQKEKFKKEKIDLCDVEITKIEAALFELKKRYNENLIDLEKKLENEKFQKNIFNEFKI